MIVFYPDGCGAAGAPAELLLRLQQAVLRPLQQGRAPARQAQHRDQVKPKLQCTLGCTGWASRTLGSLVAGL